MQQLGLPIARTTRLSGLHSIGRSRHGNGGKAIPLLHEHGTVAVGSIDLPPCTRPMKGSS